LDQRTAVVLAAVIIVVAVIAVLGWFYSRRRRSQALRDRFGPEYDRVLRQEHNVRKAEGVLEFRAERRKKLPIRALDQAARDEFSRRWTDVQSKFVDDPKGAVGEADALIIEVMKARGYPMSDFDQRAADISVDHPLVVDHYRAAHTITLNHNRGKASTEDLRKAMVHYRALFDELLNEGHNATTAPKEAIG